MLLCSAFTATDKTDALTADNIAEMSRQQWVGTNDVLCICPRPGVPSSPIVTLTKTRRSSACNCQGCVCRGCVGLPKERSTARAWRRASCSREGAVRTECRCGARRERAARQEGAAARTSCVASSPQNCSGGVRFSEPYEVGFNSTSR